MNLKMYSTNLLKRSLESWEGGHTQDIVDVVYICLSYLLPKHLFFSCHPSPAVSVLYYGFFMGPWDAWRRATEVAEGL